MNSAANHNAAFGKRAQCRRHERACGGEDNCSIKLFRRHLVRASSPLCAQRFSALLCVDVARPGEHEQIASLIKSNLGYQMRCIAKSIHAKASRIACFAIGSITDPPRTKQRSSLHIVVMLGEMKTESCIGDGEFGVTAVDGIAGEARAITEILPARPAKRTFAICPAKPRNANAISDRECGSGLSAATL